MVVSLENDSKLFAIIKEAKSGVGENFYQVDCHKTGKCVLNTPKLVLLQNCHNEKRAIHLFLQKNCRSNVRDVCCLA